MTDLILRRIRNLDEPRQRLDVFFDETQDHFAEAWAEHLEFNIAELGDRSPWQWPLLTGFSGDNFYWRQGPRDSGRQLHNLAPYARRVNEGYRFGEGGHDSGMVELAFLALNGDAMFIRSAVRTGEQAAARGDRGEHRPGLRDHEGIPIGDFSASVLFHEYPHLRSLPVPEGLPEAFRGVRQDSILGSRRVRPR